MQFTTLNVLAFAASASAATIKVAVGQNGLTYTPNNITAAVGDEVEFTFFPKNHTVTQSSFTDPCHPLAGGFFSTFQPVTAGSVGGTFSITVKDTKPIWIYCSQTAATVAAGHCQSGMTAAINAPATGNTLAAFQALAKNATLSSVPGSAVIGGTLAAASSNSSSVSSSSAAKITGGSTSIFSSAFSTSISTTAVVSTEVSSTWTSNGQAYTTSYASSYTTTYATAVATTAAVTSVSGGAAVTGAAAGSGASSMGGVVVGFFAAGVALLSAMAMA